jgi:hypothetical protein
MQIGQEHRGDITIVEIRGRIDINAANSLGKRLTALIHPCNWTEEDRLTLARWRRHVAVFYGCAALLIVVIIVLTKASSPASDQPSHLQAARSNPGADLSGKAQ